jgi:zinc/manganese transport system substrate-binding protein
MKRMILILTAVLLLCGHAALATVRVVAALPDLASIASSIGGDRVDAFAIARSTSDPHSVEVLPSYMVRVSRADIYLKVGLHLDQWSGPLVDGARNSRITVVDCSEGVTVLDKPTGPVDASMGDVHPDGNPHYWLDPQNGSIIAATIAAALTAADPDGAEVYRANLERFNAEAAQHLADWKAQVAALPHRNIISYHSSWVYFAQAFGLDIVENIEPVPGIPPTASHLAHLTSVIREKQVKVILQEPYFADDAARYLARETAVTVLKLAPSCGGADAASYFSHFRQIIDALNQAR